MSRHPILPVNRHASIAGGRRLRVLDLDQGDVRRSRQQYALGHLLEGSKHEHHEWRATGIAATGRAARVMKTDLRTVSTLTRAGRAGVFIGGGAWVAVACRVAGAPPDVPRRDGRPWCRCGGSAE